MQKIYAVKMISNDSPRFLDNSFIVFENGQQITYDIDYAVEQMQKYSLPQCYDLFVVELTQKEQ